MQSLREFSNVIIITKMDQKQKTDLNMLSWQRQQSNHKSFF